MKNTDGIHCGDIMKNMKIEDDGKIHTPSNFHIDLSKSIWYFIPRSNNRVLTITKESFRGKISRYANNVIYFFRYHILRKRGFMFVDDPRLRDDKRDLVIDNTLHL